MVSNNSQRLLSFYETSSAVAFGRMSSNLIGVVHNSLFWDFFLWDAFEALCIFDIFWHSPSGMVATIWMAEELVRRVSQTRETHNVFCKQPSSLFNHHQIVDRA